MFKKVIYFLLVLFVAVICYFVVWPVPVDPVSWNAPTSVGYTGKFAPNNRLKGLQTFGIGNNRGPEDIALDANGRIYAATHEGRIVRLQPDGSNPENWVETGGRPLGIDFDNQGNLIAADAFLGLLSISPDGSITILADVADGVPILYADDVDVALDGKIYFSDASTRFGAKEYGGTYEASLLDLMEHSGSGRLLVYDPVSQKATTLVDGLTFANGVAVSHDQTYVLVNETGKYRVIRYWIAGPKKGQAEPIIENLPGFPDNISQGLNDRFWIAFVSPRNPLLDKLSDKPFLRKVIQRMPKFIRPKATPYGHIIAINGEGQVLEDLQDPEGGYALITGVTETNEYLYIGSLIMPVLGRLSKSSVEL